MEGSSWLEDGVCHDVRCTTASYAVTMGIRMTNPGVGLRSSIQATAGSLRLLPELTSTPSGLQSIGDRRHLWLLIALRHEFRDDWPYMIRTLTKLRHSPIKASFCKRTVYQHNIKIPVPAQLRLSYLSLLRYGLYTSLHLDPSNRSAARLALMQVLSLHWTMSTHTI
jgi:hypothetical protein